MARKKREDVKQERQERVKSTMVSTSAHIIRTENVVIESNMSPAEVNATKYTRRGLVSIDESEYYFSANRFGIPVVFGATSLEAPFDLAKALDNKLKEAGKSQSFFKSDIEELYNKANVYADELESGILIIKEGNKYFGYMPGKAGCRAVCYRTGGKHYSCAVTSLIKDLDRPGKQSFRQMASQGKDIANMIEKFNKIISILDNRTNPEPTNPRTKRTRVKGANERVENTNTNNETIKGDDNKPKRSKRKEVEDKTQQQPAQPATIESEQPVQQVTIDINDDEQVATIINKALEVCLNNDSLDKLLAQLTGNNASVWIEELSEYSPSINEIADNFREDVTVLLNEQCYKLLASAVM